jgi:hypothetical protein
MKEQILPNPVQQIIFVSRETSNCPLISEMIRLGQELKNLGIPDDDIGIVSLDYGKRLLINGKNVDIKKMNRQDVVEIVDYDPLKNIIMVIGTKDPCQQMPVHWIIQKARYDVNALLQINSKTLAETYKGTLPSTEKETSAGSLEQAKEILKTLREGKTIVIRNEAVLFSGINIQEIENLLRTTIEGQK